MTVIPDGHRKSLGRVILVYYGLLSTFNIRQHKKRLKNGKTTALEKRAQDATIWVKNVAMTETSPAKETNFKEQTCASSA